MIIKKFKPLFVRDIFGLGKGKISSPTSEIKLEMKRSWDKVRR